MTTVHPREERTNAGFLGPIREASRYAISHPTLGVLILLAIAPGWIGLSYTFMLPVAAEELGIGAAGLGAPAAAVGIGGLVAGVSLETIQRRIGHGRALFCGVFGAALGLTTFGLVPGVPLAIAGLSIVGASFLTFAAANLTLIQAISPPRLRGRMVGLFSTLYWGMMPVGGLIVGLVAEQIGGEVGARPVRRRARHRGRRRAGCQAAAREPCSRARRRDPQGRSPGDGRGALGAWRSSPE